MAPEASPPLILGLESSCDETAAAVVRDGRDVLSNVIATQDDLHADFAGVVPEIASRAHLERILPVVERALADANVQLTDLDAIAVGHRPGLIGSLLVGTSAAKALAWSLGIPLVGIDHVHAHLYAGMLAPAAPAVFPALGLVVSGGHTSLFHLDDPISVEQCGHTIDDAIGEAFDKAATILGLGYPGGPAVDRLAEEGQPVFELPVSLLDRESLDFSFSGLKTALLYRVHGRPERGQSVDPRQPVDLEPETRADLAASFRAAAVRAVIKKLGRLRERRPDARTLLVGGGVSANLELRRELTAWCNEHELDLRLPPPRLCLDNAAMIAGLAAWRLRTGSIDDLELAPHPRSALASRERRR